MERWGMKRVMGVAVGIEKRYKRICIDSVKDPVLVREHSGMLTSMRYITVEELQSFRKGDVLRQIYYL